MEYTWGIITMRILNPDVNYIKFLKPLIEVKTSICEAVHTWCPGRSACRVRDKMVLCSYFEYPICNSGNNYSISPCQTSFWNTRLVGITKQWTAPKLTKMVGTKGPGAHFCTQIYKFSGTGTVSELWAWVELRTVGCFFRLNINT